VGGAARRYRVLRFGGVTVRWALRRGGLRNVPSPLPRSVTPPGFFLLRKVRWLGEVQLPNAARLSIAKARRFNEAQASPTSQSKIFEDSPEIIYSEHWVLFALFFCLVE